MEVKLKWDELSESEQEQAIYSYAEIRGNEEGTPRPLTRAKEEAPMCRAFYRDDTGYVFVDI